MGRDTIRSKINEILWRCRDELDNYVLVYEDRLSGSGFGRIPFNHIERVDKHYVYTSSRTIPLHRVVRIERIDGEIVWDRYE